jgi:hypothetical protein
MLLQFVFSTIVYQPTVSVLCFCVLKCLSISLLIFCLLHLLGDDYSHNGGGSTASYKSNDELSLSDVAFGGRTHSVGVAADTGNASGSNSRPATQQSGRSSPSSRNRSRFRLRHGEGGTQSTMKKGGLLDDGTDCLF